ncbi:Phage T7 exclusion protein [Paraburkholderia caribensis]|nr:Phage T7 exclusion protein [Paraburkholderia caribensis]
MQAAGKDEREVEPTLDVPIGSDAPQSHPSFDAFGYAPFAQAMANAVRATPSPRGLVMAVDGPWGTGKTSLLNFVKHYLSSNASEETGARDGMPVVLVDFNPWWFADKEQLAMQFLAQFRARFPAENPVLMAVADAFAEYADAIGTAVAASISSGAGVPIPLLKQFISWLLTKFRRAPKDVHKLKVDISDALSKAGARFVVFVDDIDRLAPEEIREVFKVMKAVADFPNVVYLLAFDRHLVSEALASSLGLEDGDAYVEKIVQAQFSLPVVSHDLLVQKFLDDLERLVAAPSHDDIPLDPQYWGNVLHEGISPLLETPRDVVRAVNALLVTFPHLRGEVNPVDFIALECLRVFVPQAYAVVRDNKQRFSGIARERADREQERAFHQGWLDLITARHREPVQAMIRRLFPRLQSVWGNVFYGAESQTTWSTQARVCDPEKFDRYFQFAVSPHVLGERELRAFIALDADADALAEAWTAANNERRPQGTGKANDFIAALIKRDDLPVSFARACLAAFFEVGDEFLSDPRNTIRHFFSVRAEIQAYWLVHHLTKALPGGDRETVIVERVSEGHAIALACHTTYSIASMHQPDAAERDSVFRQFAEATVQQLKGIVVERLRESARAGTLSQLPDINFLLRLWQSWGDPAEAQQWFGQAFESDDDLLRLLADSVQVGTVETVGDRVARRVVSVHPRIFEPYLPPMMDLEGLATRVSAIVARRQLDASETEAVQAFEAGMALIRNGRGAGDPFARVGL